MLQPRMIITEITLRDSVRFFGESSVHQANCSFSRVQITRAVGVILRVLCCTGLIASATSYGMSHGGGETNRIMEGQHLQQNVGGVVGGGSSVVPLFSRAPQSGKSVIGPLALECRY